MESKHDVRMTLRCPDQIDMEYRKIAEKDGISKNSAMVQALAWALEFRRGVMSVDRSKENKAA